MYIVTEYQTTGDVTSILTYTYTDRNIAEQKYHEILAYAAISTVPIHAASMANEYGGTFKNEYYEHPEIAPTPTPDPEPEST